MVRVHFFQERNRNVAASLNPVQAFRFSALDSFSLAIDDGPVIAERSAVSRQYGIYLKRFDLVQRLQEQWQCRYAIP